MSNKIEIIENRKTENHNYYNLRKDVLNTNHENNEIKFDSRELNYHEKQWDLPKQSTLEFEKFINEKFLESKNIIDMGAGSGAPTAYFAKKYNSVNFTAFEYSKELIDIGKKIISKQNINNLIFEQGDWINLNLVQKYDGCISLQTLSWLPDYEAPLFEIFNKIQPEFIGLTSLFYEGDITCRIEVVEHARNNLKHFYNVYSLPSISRFCEINNYKLSKYLPFEIDIDIDKPKDLNLMSTYTEKIYTKDEKYNKRIQLSGPLLMNWYMLLIEKCN